ncbi:hypothetical protein DL766_009148 [Monosporascus sp. MC13-8B]|uniref:Uncharacterized protein n=1 Tax=Monosporascus cannonballus TaxID=155416 RepID=A0ABY0H3S8_9PEZI|nr:hypothetical protein DL762_007400 [Monosporascus cannonballus]RYO81307.1 hypothetical protein DL763_008613 [Monosporascus cannonballus]RYP16364.1 hypothetical protein DL766_009148 [Monosporascus sp. MC13-8B]
MADVDLSVVVEQGYGYNMVGVRDGFRIRANDDSSSSTTPGLDQTLGPSNSAPEAGNTAISTTTTPAPSGLSFGVTEFEFSTGAKARIFVGVGAAAVFIALRIFYSGGVRTNLLDLEKCRR